MLEIRRMYKSLEELCNYTQDIATQTYWWMICNIRDFFLCEKQKKDQPGQSKFPKLEYDVLILYV